MGNVFYSLISYLVGSDSMKTLSYSLLFLLAALNFVTLTHQPLPLPAPLMLVNPSLLISSSNVFIQDTAREGFGSGVVIEIGGTQYVLTAYHVVRDIPQEDEVLISQGSSTWRGKVHFVSSNPDLALILPHERLPLPAAVLDLGTDLIQGEEIWYIGNPSAWEGVVEKTIVNLAPSCDQYFMVSGLGWYGNSGGGVYVIREGKPVLVGIVVRLAWRGGKAPILCENQESLRSFLAHVPQQ